MHTHTHTTYLLLSCWLQLPMSTTSSQSTPGGFTSFPSKVSTPMIAFKSLSNASNGGGHPSFRKLWLSSLCLSSFGQSSCISPPVLPGVSLGHWALCWVFPQLQHLHSSLLPEAVFPETQCSSSILG